MADKKQNFLKGGLMDFSGLKIELASPEDIMDWSYGEVTKPETINYRTWRPEKDGLFCEKIFGPTKSYHCYCGKYKKFRHKGVICDKCGVEVTHSRVRRERMGHINLAVPIVHLWFWRNNFSPLALLLDMSRKDLEGVIYFSRYLVLDVDGRKQRGVKNKIEDNIEIKIKKIKKEVKFKLKKLTKIAEKKEEQLQKQIKDKDQFEIALKELMVRFRQKKQRIKNKQAIEVERLRELQRILIKKGEKLDVLSVLSEKELSYFIEFDADDFFEVSMGGEAILKALQQVSLKKVVKRLRKAFKKTRSKQKKKKLMRKIRLANGMLDEGIDPEWMVLRVLPVIPPDLRPMVQLSGGRFATSDLNDLYRRVINRNNRLKRLMELGAPEIILCNEKRMLQEAVDILIDATKGSTKSRYKNRPMRSLTDLLKGKKGRFRRNLLGKRVDYSGRSVIVVGPELKLNQCGLPKTMALEMFKPFILREVILRGLAPNIRGAKELIEEEIPEVYEILEEVIKDKLVLLNRAPTLHKLSIQAFYPVLTDGLAIRISPCICSGFNADFDGDQMGVHLPLSVKAQKEAKELMTPKDNLLKPASGRPVITPSKEMVVGSYFLTSVREEDQNKIMDKKLKGLKIFGDSDEVLIAWQLGAIEIRQLIGLEEGGKIIKTTAGRVYFNSLLPKDLGFINEAVDSFKVKQIVETAFDTTEKSEVLNLVDTFKDLGFFGANYSGISPSIFDCKSLPKKKDLISEANKKAGQIEENYTEGLITEVEKDDLLHNMWIETTEEIADLTWERFSQDDPIKLISDAGIKRVSRDQIKQISGMRGLVVDPTGKIVPLPTKSNFREGLSVFEYVTGARGSRKGLIDTALKTADAGYLTRRLVDASHTSLVREKDCGTTRKLKIKNSGPRKKSFGKRILGRYLAETVKKPGTKKTLAKKNTLIDKKVVKKIIKNKVKEIWVRSPLTCRTVYGVCAKCYGWDLATREEVKVGMPVGVVAAQSIGEPGTQLTMRTKHSGGVVGQDVTQGLPRVQELLETRNPKQKAPLAEFDGEIRIREQKTGYQIKLISKKRKTSYKVPLTSKLLVKDEEKVLKGTRLIAGSLDIEEILDIRGLRETQKYLLEEIQAVYESQGVSIHDKHFEIIIREMSSKVRIISSGDTDFVLGEYVEAPVYYKVNKKIKEKKGGNPARGRRVILGLTKSALHAYSWLSAASFQNTSNILTEAAVLGREDPLIGLKENVIIGRLIPTTPERAKLEDF